MRRLVAFGLGLGAALWAFAGAVPAAAEEPSVVISIKDHRFDPEQVEVPAGQRVKIVFRNLDPTPEEFESDDIGFEKIVMGNMQTTVYVGPLDPGTYKFFGEFHLDTAQGVILAK